VNCALHVAPFVQVGRWIEQNSAARIFWPSISRTTCCPGRPLAPLIDRAQLSSKSCGYREQHRTRLRDDPDVNHQDHLAALLLDAVGVPLDHVPTGSVHIDYHGGDTAAVHRQGVATISSAQLERILLEAKLRS
jgi:hypothetical protein